MTGDVPTKSREGCSLPQWVSYALILGLYLTLRGYHSLDGDQAYRLPLLLHQQDARVFAGDPFVQAFEAFNPHRGSLLLLDVVTRPLGLSLGLFTIFVLTFDATCLGVDRLSRAVWPDAGPNVGLVAVALVLVAKAGNIGTNHLFEAMFLDRLAAFALGWLALAYVVADPARGLMKAVVALAVATLVHPSVGLQLAIVTGASFIAWCVFGRPLEVSPRSAIMGVVGLAVAVIPGLAVNLAPGSSLLGDMPARDFWLLTAELQSPQHMLPHLWRMPQWLGWSCYVVLAALACLYDWRSRAGMAQAIQPQADPIGRYSPAQLRLTVILAIILVWLGSSWFAIEVQHQLRVTVFQPFRMATIARGIALVLVAGRLLVLWRSGGWLGRLRATLMSVAFGGDWLLVFVTMAEVTVSAVEAIRFRVIASDRWRVIDALVWFGMLAFGFNFLARHDTEFGNRTLVTTLVVGLIVEFVGQRRKNLAGLFARSPAWAPRRVRVAFVVAWIVPLASLVAAEVPLEHPISRHSLVTGLVGRCRFAAVPADDVERLALWCRDHTPVSARFIGPPGPKTFRLWSLRSLAFNRAASPYNGNGLADWFSRFQEHVNFHGSPAEFVRAYLADRHGFESRYQAQTDAERAALAIRQGATYVVADARAAGDDAADSGPLKLLHVEGRYAVYQVRLGTLVQHQR